MTKFICMECFKHFDDKFIKWYKKNPNVRDTQVCAKCYGKHIIHDLLDDIPEAKRKNLDFELIEIMELLHPGN
tara:strand:+ start:6023 stop:6241 length:219 start_codon:yes stop_codon:yes gene_type:complete